MTIEKSESVDVVELKRTVDTLVSTVMPNLLASLQSALTTISFDILAPLYEIQEDPLQWVFNQYFTNGANGDLDINKIYVDAIKQLMTHHSNGFRHTDHVNDHIVDISFSWKGPHFYGNESWFEMRCLPKGKYDGPTRHYTTRVINDLNLRSLFRLLINNAPDQTHMAVRKAMFLDARNTYTKAELDTAFVKQMHSIFVEDPSVKTWTLLDVDKRDICTFTTRYSRPDNDIYQTMAKRLSCTYRPRDTNVWLDPTKLPFKEKLDLMFKMSQVEISWVKDDSEEYDTSLFAGE